VDSPGARTAEIPGEPTREIEPLYFDSYGQSEAGFFEKFQTQSNGHTADGIA